MSMKIIRTILATAATLASANAFATGTLVCTAKTDSGTPVRVSATYSWSTDSIVSDVTVAVGEPGHEALIITHPQQNIVGQFLDSANEVVMLRVMDSQVMNTLVRIQEGKSVLSSARIFEISAPQTQVSTANFTCEFR